MKERPILFNGAMVQAILAGRKTQTRREMKPQPDTTHDGEPYWNIGGYRAWQFRGVTDPLRMGAFNPIECPFGKPGDRLYVRETWCPVTHGSYEPWEKSRKTPKSAHEAYIHYRADNTLPRLGSDNDGFWRPSIHMPRWASRITLEIVSVRVERLNQISEEDAQAEGCEKAYDEPYESWRHLEAECGYFSPSSYESGFSQLWQSVYGPGSFDDRWVWVVEFKRL